MFRFLRRLFGFKDNASQLSQRSADIKNVFTKTVDDLNSLNKEIDAERTHVSMKIAKLQLEENQLNQTKAANEKVIENINKILE